jgi:iron-sulfur cluster assembly accessory protein
MLFPRSAQLTRRLPALNYRVVALATARAGRRIDETPMSDIQVSERAAKRIGTILKGEPAGAMLRVSVEGGGCSGFQYKFDIERQRASDDVAIERDGVTVLVDPVSVPYLAGSEIDFVDDLLGAAFKVHNPNATASCGCGTSFTI